MLIDVFILCRAILTQSLQLEGLSRSGNAKRKGFVGEITTLNQITNWKLGGGDVMRPTFYKFYLGYNNHKSGEDLATWRPVWERVPLPIEI